METPFKVEDFKAIRLRLASSDEILSWSHGEILKPETINYRTQRAEKDGLFCERIFGPEKDWECYCGKYRKVRYKGVVCDKCGVEVTRSIVRRERMGHIKLAAPIAHIWFVRGTPSLIGLLLDLSVQQLERVIYFNGYIVKRVDEDAKRQVVEEIEQEYKTKRKQAKTKAEQEKLTALRDQRKSEVNSLIAFRILSEPEYFDVSMRYGQVFDAGTGAEAINDILSTINLPEVEQQVLAMSENALSPQRRRLLLKLRFVRGFLRSGSRPEWMIMRALPVIPPDLRPMVQLDGGRYASSDLNDLYRRVINRNNRLKYLQEINAPEVIQRNEKRMLQEAVDSLLDNSMRKGQQLSQAQGAKRRPLKSIADILKGKQGRFRQNLLGKRVDYSGRSVIVIGSELGLDRCGLPKKMALELFRPFVIRKILEQELAYNIRAASHLIDEAPASVWAILEEVIQEKYVLLNRAPTLHRLGIQAFRPILIEGDAIQIPALVCPAFNADFDGDQMAVHVPLGQTAQEEARDLMLGSKGLLKPANGIPVAIPRHDIVLGCFWASQIRENVAGAGHIFTSIEECELAHGAGVLDVRARIYVPKQKEDFWRYTGKDSTVATQAALPSPHLMETSLGRLRFNRLMPDDFPFINEELTAKKLEALTAEFIEEYSVERTAPLLDRITAFGFEHATHSGVSWGMDDLLIPQAKAEIVAAAKEEVDKIYWQYEQGLLTDRERRVRVIETWRQATGKVWDQVGPALERFGSPRTIVESGARGSWAQPRQMAGMKGLVTNPAGQIIEMPIISSLKEGMNVLEYFISTHGARKGTTDTALRTASAGYLTRRLVDVAQEVMITMQDCRDAKGIPLLRDDSASIGQDFALRMIGRVIAQDVAGSDGTVLVAKNKSVSRAEAFLISRDQSIVSVQVRSPMTCKAEEGICQLCYGWDLGRNKVVDVGEAVGIVAAQSIGEPGTQLTMRTFHTGGVAGTGDITLGLTRVEEIFEARPPQDAAVLSEVSGKVLNIEQEDATKEKVITVEAYTEEATEKKKKKSAKTASSPSGERKFSGELKIYRTPPATGILVKAGDGIEKGDPLSEGSVDLKTLFKLAGISAVRRYIIQEVQRIYVMEGVNINDKHIEIIARQMFSRVRIKDAGDTRYTGGEVITKTQLAKENTRVLAENKKPAQGHTLLLGITKASLTSASFLAAASFQETARVLIAATPEGRIDELRGLKENVIIGKLIPAGRGFGKKIFESVIEDHAKQDAAESVFEA